MHVALFLASLPVYVSPITARSYREACSAAKIKVGEIILVGNMADKTSKVPFEKVKIWAEQQGISKVVEVSAFKNEGVKEAFQAIIKAPQQDALIGVSALLVTLEADLECFIVFL